MVPISLLLGKSRRRRMRRFPGAQLTALDAIGRPPFLVVTATRRKAQSVSREIQRLHPSGHVFAPRVEVFTDLWKELWLRRGSGKALLSQRAAGLAACELVRETDGWLASIGRPEVVGRALARILYQREQVRHPGSLELDGHGPLARALDLLAKRLDRLDGFARPAVALHGLLERLSTPDDSLRAWLGAPSEVLIEDLLTLSDLEAEFLVALCAAWQREGVSVTLTLETGRALGGAEAGQFFGYDDVDPVAYPLKSFAATRRLRQVLFDRFVAEGHGSLLLAHEHEVVELDPGAPPGKLELPDLADLVYARHPTPVRSELDARALLRDTVRFVKTTDDDAELRFIARSVKRRLVQGAEPAECLVAIAQLADRGPRVAEVFDDLGIPWDMSAGARLAHSPVANLVRRIATVALNNWPPDTLLGILESSLVSAPATIPTRALRLWCRAAGVTGGEPASWQEPIEAWVRREGWRRGVDAAQVAEAIQRLQASMAPLRALAVHQAPRSWFDSLIECCDTLGLTVRMAHCAEAAEVAGANLVAWGALLREMESLVLDLQASGTHTVAPRTLVAELERAIASATHRPGRTRKDVVQIIDAHDLVGLTPRFAWLGGLSRGNFPANRPRPFLVSPTVARRLDARQPMAEARYLFFSLLRNALDDPEMCSVTISWPSIVEGRPAAPAAPLADLLSVRTAETGTLLGDWLVERAMDSDRTVLSHTDLLRRGDMGSEAANSAMEPVFQGQRISLLAR